MNCTGPKCEFCIQDVYNVEISYLSGSDEWHYTLPCQWEQNFVKRAFVLQINQIGCISKKDNSIILGQKLTLTYVRIERIKRSWQSQSASSFDSYIQ